MGSSVGRGIPNQGTSGSFYGNPNLPKLEPVASGRRSMPGGPLLPRSPRNPLAIAARRTVGLSIPRLPNRFSRTL